MSCEDALGQVFHGDINGRRYGHAHVVLLANVLQVPDDLRTKRGVKPTRRLIQEQNLRIRDKAARYRYSFLLPATETLPDGRSDDGLGVRLQAETRDDIVNTSQELLFRGIAGIQIRRTPM